MPVFDKGFDQHGGVTGVADKAQTVLGEGTDETLEMHGQTISPSLGDHGDIFGIKTMLLDKGTYGIYITTTLALAGSNVPSQAAAWGLGAASFPGDFSLNFGKKMSILSPNKHDIRHSSPDSCGVTKYLRTSFGAEIGCFFKTL